MKTASRNFRAERTVCLGHEEFVVSAYTVIGTDQVTFAVFEKADGFQHHSTVTHSAEHGRLGSVRTRALPDEIAALPYGDERTAACDEWHRALDATCDRLIRAAFPEVSFESARNGTAWARLDHVQWAVRS